MSLDDPRNAAHAHAIEVGAEPEWLRMARAQENAERRTREAEMRERDELESVETMEALWVGRFQHSARDREPVHYDRPDADRRVFAVDGEIPEQARRDAS